MKRYGFFLVFCLWLLVAPGAGQGVLKSLTVTYLYDNTSASAGVKPDWGFSCLIQGDGNSVLFDAGANPEILRANVAALRVDVSRFNAVVFSHDHADHTAGVAALGERRGLPAFFPASFGEATRAAFAGLGLRLMPVSKETAVLPGFATSDEIGGQLREEALIAEIPDGLVVVVGCAHPGIIPMLKQIARSRNRPIYMVIGGLHLYQTPVEEIKQIVSEFKSMGIAYAGPTHCTGNEGLKLFQEAYGAHFIAGGVGTIIRAPAKDGR